MFHTTFDEGFLVGQLLQLMGKSLRKDPGQAPTEPQLRQRTRIGQSKPPNLYLTELFDMGQNTKSRWACELFIHMIG